MAEQSLTLTVTRPMPPPDKARRYLVQTGWKLQNQYALTDVNGGYGIEFWRHPTIRIVAKWSSQNDPDLVAVMHGLIAKLATLEHRDQLAIYDAICAAL